MLNDLNKTRPQTTYKISPDTEEIPTNVPTDPITAKIESIRDSMGTPPPIPAAPALPPLKPLKPFRKTKPQESDTGSSVAAMNKSRKEICEQAKSKIEARQEIRIALNNSMNECLKQKDLDKIEGGPELIVAIHAYQALGPEQKNGEETLSKVVEVLGCIQKLNEDLQKTSGEGDEYTKTELIQTIDILKKCANAEISQVAEIQQALRTLGTNDSHFEETGIWNSQGGLRIKSVMLMPKAKQTDFDLDCKSVERMEDSKRQILKFIESVRSAVTESDSFAVLVLECMREQEGQFFDMFFGKGAVGFYDSYESSGIDQDDLDRLAKIPKQIGSIKAGTTDKEVMAHVLEERLIARDQKCNYKMAHSLSLTEGSYQNRYRNDIGIPDASLAFTECIHEDTCAGCKDFVAMSALGYVTKLPHIPVELKEKQTLSVVQQVYQELEESIQQLGLNPEATVEQRYVGDEHVVRKQVLDDLIQEALLAVKKEICNPQSLVGKSRFEWSDYPDLLKFISMAENEDEQAIVVRAKQIKEEMDIYKDAVEQKIILPIDLELQKTEAQKLQETRGTTPPEEFLVRQRNKRQELVINSGSRNDDSTNCALCTMGAILDIPTTEASKKVQRTFSPEQEFDEGLQGEYLFLNTALGMTTKEERKIDQLPADYVKDVETRYNLTPPTPIQPPFTQTAQANYLDQLNRYENKILRLIEGDFQFEGLRLMLEKGIEERNMQPDSVCYKVLQDGVPDKPEYGGMMYQWPTLIERMSAFPNGTQFQVFLHGTLDHWIYAEKVQGKIIFEDYQKNEAREISKTIKAPSLTDDELIAKYPDRWNEEISLFKSERGLAPEMPISSLIKSAALLKLRQIYEKENSVIIRTEHLIPNSAYVASSKNKPHHPQHDEQAEAFQEGMYFAIVPKESSELPIDLYEKKIDYVHNFLRSGQWEK